jgi:microcystin-dependent protein
MSTVIVNECKGKTDPNYTLLPFGICDPAFLAFEDINGAYRLTIKKNALDASLFAGDFLADGSITTEKLADGCVTTEKIHDGAVTTAKLADHCVTQIKIAFKAVTNTEIAEGTIETHNIAPSAIVTDSINNAAVTNPKLADGCIVTRILTTACITNDALAAGCITVSKLGSDVLAMIQASYLPPGTVVATASPNVPTGYLLCDGAQVSRTVFATLFAYIGGYYGAGDGSTTFNLPDMRGRSPIGAGQGGSLGLSNRWLGETGGEENHVLTVNEMPYHNHDILDYGHSHGVNEPWHNHGVSQSPHAHALYDGTHKHLGWFSTNADAGGPGPGTSFSAWGIGPGGGGLDYGVVYSGGTVFVSAYPTSTDSANIAIYGANANVSIDATWIGISIAGAYASVSNTPAGASWAHNNMPPFCAINWFIKV